MLLKSLSVSALLFSSLLASATTPHGSVEKSIAETLSKAFSMPVDKVTKSAHGDLYEVLSPQGLSYTDKTASFMIFNGVVIDAKTKENLTEARMNVLSAFNFKDLPLKDAVKTVIGNGSRTIVTVEDPNCGFCKKLHPELMKLNNVTIYTFIVPMLGAESVTKSRSIMCSKNPAMAWEEWMKDAKEPVMVGECETPLERNLILSKKLYVRGTPNILFESGDRIPGFTTADKIEEKLASLKSTKKVSK